MHSHDNAALAAIATVSTLLGGGLGEKLAAALTALVVSVAAQLLLRFLFPSADELGRRAHRRLFGDRATPAPAVPAPDVPGR
ncbi:MAG: hypothetical protein JWM10_2997, partial [Myxococcaceae bacterium]|nr:hypothetical protein [Myxococcaceae bacterium]